MLHMYAQCNGRVWVSEYVWMDGHGSEIENADDKNGQTIYFEINIYLSKRVKY